MEIDLPARPCVRSPQKNRQFEDLARQLELQPQDRWVGGYVDYEWDHLRLVLELLPLRLEGLPVLEFGCNVGASAILLSHLGAQVHATDISADWVRLAQLNAERHGIGDINFSYVGDTRRLPFADGAFQLVTCNSVLEYVAPAQLPAVQRELDRVLAPGGMILLTGTSNRLWPQEAHSQRWLANYLPRWCDRLFRSPPQRGLWPWQVRRGFGYHYDNLDSAAADGYFARSRRSMGIGPARLLPLLWLARGLGVGPGLLAQHLSCLLQKRPAP